MRLSLRHLPGKSYRHLVRFCRWLWHCNWLVQAGLVLLLLALGIRSMAYLMPVQAEDLAQVDQAVEFRDRNHRPLGTLLSRDQEHTAVVPLEQISPYFLQAILAAEDQRFYHHGAVDWQAVIRASLQSLKARRIVSGASTVTMQLARMVEPVPRTWGGKVQQVWHSWRIAAGMDKDEILAAYVNRLPMGGNIYGVEAAARVYFGIPAADLTLAQASLLAALPNAPTALNPYFHWDALKQRQRYVLNRMIEDGYVSQEEFDGQRLAIENHRAFAETVTVQPPGQTLLVAPHFLFWLAEQLPSDHPALVQTTLDLTLQHFVEAQVQKAIEGLAPHQVRQAAALVIDNASGEVLAYVGSPSYFAPQQSGRNDGVQTLRQPGSTLKPFLYQLALERGIIEPNTILQDVPTHYPIPGGRLYSPTDYSNTFQGPVRVRMALANSLNIPAVQILADVTVPVFLERLHELGFDHLDRSPDYYGLGLALGSGEVTLWELAQAYLVLAHGGDFGVSLSPIKPRSSFKATMRESLPRHGFESDSSPGVGKSTLPLTRPNLSPSPHLPISPSPHLPISSSPHLPISSSLHPSIPPSPHWSLVTDMLADRHARAAAFGVDSVLNLPFPAAVKTGTSSDYRDTWTVGFTPDYIVATWVGNFDGSPMRQVSGVTGAAPLWHRIMVHLHENHEPENFDPPTGMVKRPICALTGQRPSASCEAVVQEYFSLEDLATYERSVPEAIPVANQGQTNLRLHIISPKAGSRFLLYASENGGQEQRLEFALKGEVQSPVEWRLNGQPLDASSKTSLFWPMQRGDWTLEVQSGEQHDQVHFKVDLAESRPAHQGFSVVDD